VDRDGLSQFSDKFILGQNNNAGNGGEYGAATFDEMEFWYASRDYLLAFGYIFRGNNTFVIMCMIIFLNETPTDGVDIDYYLFL
jgi:hypothetical protein